MKKRITCFVMAALMLLSCTACSKQRESFETDIVSEQSESAQKDLFGDNELSAVLKLQYHEEYRHFHEFFSPEEYVKLCTVAAEMSSEPRFAISNSAFLVRQKIATYNSSETYYYIIDTSGNVLIDYGENGWVDDFYGNYIQFGNLTFIKTNGNPLRYDIVNEKGSIVNSVKYEGHPMFSPISDLGYGYNMFIVVNDFDPPSYDLYILHPSGTCALLTGVSGYWNAQVHGRDRTEEITYIPCEIDATIGKLNEGLLSVCYSYTRIMGDLRHETCAYYCNVNGEVIINLSSEEMNFSVDNLGDFKNGQAEIRFTGADGKKYTVFIDKEGNFVGEPKTI